MFALVLGGGGSAGIGWETGVLHGLASAGLDLSTAAHVIGTSAGAVVGARLRLGSDPADLYAHVGEPTERRATDMDYSDLQKRWAAATTGARSADDARRRIAAMALSAETMPPAARRAEIAAMLPGATWPAAPFAVIAVNGATGELVAFTRQWDVDLIDAVAASCAVPGVWPPVTIGDAPYVDGAVRSPTNADQAAGFPRVLVIAPMLPVTGIERELRRLPADTRYEVIAADAAAQQAFGDNPLDPSTASAAAAHGLRQGRAEARRVAALVGADAGQNV